MQINKSMSINEIIKPGVNITVAVGINELREIYKELIAEVKKELEQTVLSDKAETYPSPKQVCDILGVNITTLWRWQKKDYLVPMEVGGKRRYRMSDVKALLNGGRNK